MRAVVLTAGVGSRLGEHTKDTPKPMLDVGGVPLLDHILGNLARAGFSDVALNLHFRGDLIRDHVGDGARFGLRVVYSSEETLLGTAGGARRMSALLGGEGPLVVHYGDILTSHDLASLWQRHHERAADATLLVHRRAGSNSVLTLDDDDRVTGFVERPAQRETVEHWVFSGIAVLSLSTLDRISTAQASDLPRDILVPMVAAGAVVVGAPLQGFRCAIDSPARLEQARAALRSGALATRRR
ncbi:MAG: nucleotidyltransferase family protein [Deltaproteobacteria bacterium]|nr:nucleotidyltransferase family protein [Deltaproteobacteria bacterium]